MSGSQQGHLHPFCSHSVSLSTSIHHHLAYLDPFFQLFQSLFPHLLSPEKDRLRVAMVMMWCCRRRAEVIEELLIRCGEDVMSHHVFFYCGHLTFSSPPILPALFCPSLCLLFCSQDMLSSFCQCWTKCPRDMVLTPSSTFQDAVQQWVWPYCKCAHTPGSLNERNEQFTQTPEDKYIISATVKPELTRLSA